MAAVLDDLASTLARIVAVLRTMPPGRLAAPLRGPTPTRADAGRLLARTLAVATQGIEDAEEPAMPSWRSLPEVADLVVGDQVNVLAHDFCMVVEAHQSMPEVWTPDGRAPLVDVLHDVAATAAEVHRLL